MLCIISSICITNQNGMYVRYKNALLVGDDGVKVKSISRIRYPLCILNLFRGIKKWRNREDSFATVY